MINERYRQNKDDNNITLRTALKGTAVAGAIGLAAAYQPFGRRAVKFLGRIVDTVKKTSRSMEGPDQLFSMRDYTKSDYKRLYDNLRDNWTKSAITVNRIRLDTNSNGSLAAYIQSVENMVSQARNRAEDAWLQDHVRKDALSQLRQQHFDRNTSSNVESFIAKAVQNAANFGRNMELARQHKLEGQALSFAEQISKDIQVRYDRAIKQKTGADADIIQKLTDTIETELKKHAYNIDTMERALGTANSQSISDLSVMLLSHAHKMTWQEAKSLGNSLEDTTYLQGDMQKSVKAAMTEIEQHVKQHYGDEGFNRLMQITIDESNLFMTRENHAFSKQTSGQLWRDFLAFSRNTLPGKLLKIGDIDNALRLPATQMINLQANDPVLRAKLKQLGEEDKYHVRIGKDIFSVDINKESGSRISFNQDLNNGDIRVVSGRFGFYHSQIEALSGKTKTSISDNWLFNQLDIFQDREEYSGHFIANKLSILFGEGGRKERFATQVIMTPEYRERYKAAIAELHAFSNSTSADFLTGLSSETKDFIAEYMETQRKISDMFRSNTYKLTESTIDAFLQNQNLNAESRKVFELLKRDDSEEILNYFLNKQGHLKIRPVVGSHAVNFLNHDLENLIKGVIDNPEIAKNKISLVTNEMRLSYGTDLINLLHTPMGNTTYTFNDVLKREVAKEALLRQGLESTTSSAVNYDLINELLDSTLLTDINAKEAEKLAHFAIWQRHTGINRRTRTDNLMYMDYFERMMRTDELLRGDTEVAKRFQESYITLLSDEVSAFEENISSETPGVESLEDYVAINRSASPLDIVQGLNRAIFLQDTSKIKSDVMNIVQGLSANREDMSGANLYTFVPFFAFKRLSDELNKVGLGFSAESTKSTMDLAMSFMTKRVLPIAVGATYLDFTDDIARETTGTGLWEGFTAGVANVDLAGRRIISSFGLDEWMKQTKAVNPIWQYWGDRDDYQSYEERQRYYQKGYTPVRKAAWSEVGHAA